MALTSFFVEVAERQSIGYPESMPANDSDRRIPGSRQPLCATAFPLNCLAVAVCVRVADPQKWLE
jgi:hypothetical protein